MCSICDGKTLEENIDDLRDIVRRCGWAVVMVEPPPGGVGLAYTIGLHVGYRHPELLVVDDDVHRAHRHLNELGRRVRDGEVLSPDTVVPLGPARAELLAVHEVHARSDMVAQWHNVHDMDTDDIAPPFLQVVVPDLVAASGRRAMRTRFDVPSARPPV
jgi:hypothetical protein